jgi:hypothetical protein
MSEPDWTAWPLVCCTDASRRMYSSCENSQFIITGVTNRGKQPIHRHWCRTATLFPCYSQLPFVCSRSGGQDGGKVEDTEWNMLATISYYPSFSFPWISQFFSLFLKVILSFPFSFLQFSFLLSSFLRLTQFILPAKLKKVTVSRYVI